MNITTTYKTNSNGTGQVLVKGQGRQRTVAWDQSKSTDWNHGTAVEALLRVLDNDTDGQATTAAMRAIDGGTAIHTANDSGTKHRFSL